MWYYFIPLISLDTFIQIQPKGSLKDHFTPLKSISPNMKIVLKLFKV